MIRRFVPLAPLLLLCLAARGQTPKPSFEVASVKPATPLGPMGMRSDRRGGPGTNDPGRYTCLNCPVFWVLSEAYDLQTYEYVGPDWANHVRFDFDARIPPGTDKAAFHAMLQSLLADRFHLAAHREKKEMMVYALTLGKGGPKFRESKPHDDPQPDGAAPAKMQRDKDGFPVLAPGTTMAAIPGHARIRSDNQPISWFTGMLSGQLQSPVVDETGLTAKYDFIVSWAWDENRAPGDAPVDQYHPALIEAVQSQLGLKMEHKKGQVDVLVVDHMEKTPTAN